MLMPTAFLRRAFAKTNPSLRRSAGEIWRGGYLLWLGVLLLAGGQGWGLQQAWAAEEENDKPLWQQLQKVRDDWRRDSAFKLSDDFPPDAPGYIAMKNYLGEEDGVRKPLRTGQEVALYNALKVKIAQLKPGEKLDPPQLLLLGLQNDRPEDGQTVYLPRVYHTILNVMRLLTRPGQWTGKGMVGDYGHPASDPVYPILQDILGVQSSDDTPTLAEQFSVRRHENGGVIQDQYSLDRLFAEDGVFEYFPGARNASVNGGAHYYFWTGALGEEYFGRPGVAAAGIQEEVLKWWIDNDLARGIYQVEYLHRGKTLAQQMRSVNGELDPALMWDSDSIGAITRLPEDERIRVKNLLSQLEKLEAKVRTWVDKTAERKNKALADLSIYRHFIAIMRDAKAYRHQHGERLAQLLQAQAQAAPHCNAIRGEIESLKRTLAQASAMQQRVEKQLLDAQQQVKACAGKDALRQADEAYQQVQQQVSQNPQGSFDLDRQNLQSAQSGFQSALDEVASGTPSTNAAPFDEGRTILARLQAYADEAELNAVDIGGASDRVAQDEEAVESERQQLMAELESFKQVFPKTSEWEEKQGVPEIMAKAWWGRLDRLVMTVNAVTFVDLEAWQQQRRALAAQYPGLDADSKLFIQSIRQEASRFEKQQDAINQCLTGPVNWTKTAADLIERIDTQQTLIHLAFDKLGQGYRELRTACAKQLDGGAPTAVAAATPGKDAHETFKPVHLFELLNKQGKTFFKLYAKVEPSHLHKKKGGWFRFPDGNGGWYHNQGRDLGVFTDKASVCAVLRGKGVFSVSYNLSWWSLSCPKEGPVTPVGAPGTQPSGGASNAPRLSVAGAFFLVEMMIGDVRVYFDSPDQAQPLTRDQPLPAGATVVTGINSSIRLQSTGSSIEIGAGTEATWRPAGNKDKEPAVFEMNMGSLLVDHSPEQAPGFDGLEVRTPHARVRPVGTRYKVSADAHGSYVQVFEGQIEMTGEMLARTDANFQLPGKSAFPKTLVLSAGQYGKAFVANLADNATPAWLGGKPAVVAQPARGSGQPGQVPGWLTQDLTSTVETWQQANVQNWMDRWLKEARPAVSKAGLTFRYSDWGVLLSSAARTAGPPEHPSGWTRHRYVWERRDKLDSWNLCTLGEYLRRRQSGAGLSDCARPEPKPAQTPSVPSANMAKPVAPTSKQPQKDMGYKDTGETHSADLSAWFKTWACQYRRSARDQWRDLRPFALSRAGDALFVHLNGGRYPLQGRPQNNRYTVHFDYPGRPEYYHLELGSDRLTLSGRLRGTGSNNQLAYEAELHCQHAGPGADVSVFGRR